MSAELLVAHNIRDLLPLFAPGAQAWWRRHHDNFECAHPRPTFAELFEAKHRTLVKDPGYWARKSEEERERCRAQIHLELERFAARYAELCAAVDSAKAEVRLSTSATDSAPCKRSKSACFLYPSCFFGEERRRKEEARRRQQQKKREVRKNL